MRTTIYIHRNLWKQAKVMAAEDGRTFSGLVTRLIVEKIKEKECKKQPRKEVKPMIVREMIAVLLIYVFLMGTFIGYHAGKETNSKKDVAVKQSSVE